MLMISFKALEINVEILDNLGNTAIEGINSSLETEIKEITKLSWYWWFSLVALCYRYISAHV